LNRTTFLTATFFALTLSACASVPQQPIAFNMQAVTSGPSRIAIYMDELPPTDTDFPGAACLLCIAVARGAHSDLSTQVQSLQPEGLDAIPMRMAEVLRAKGAHVTLVTDRLKIDELENNPTKEDGAPVHAKDFRPLAKRLDADKLIVLSFFRQGVIRSYSSYVPTDAPKAYVTGVGYMVDLRTNSYDWYSPLEVYKPADGAWNEPPTFPGLTNAYYQVLVEASDTMVSRLTQNAAPAAGALASQSSAPQPK